MRPMARQGALVFKALRHHRVAVIGFTAVLLVGVGARALNGAIPSSDALVELYSSIQNNARHLGSAVATSSATIMALMLTMIGLVHRVRDELDERIYPTVALIALASASTLVASTLLLLAITLPVEDFTNVPGNWRRILYEVVFATTVLVSAKIIAVVLMLLSTVLMLVRDVGSGSDTEDGRRDEESPV